MDDRKIVSDRELELDREVEAARRKAEGLPPDDTDEMRGTDGTGSNDLGGSSGPDQTSSVAARTSDWPRATDTAMTGHTGVPMPSDRPADEDVEPEDGPGESLTPRTG